MKTTEQAHPTPLDTLAEAPTDADAPVWAVRCSFGLWMDKDSAFPRFGQDNPARLTRLRAEQVRAECAAACATRKESRTFKVVRHPDCLAAAAHAGVEAAACDCATRLDVEKTELRVRAEAADRTLQQIADTIGLADHVDGHGAIRASDEKLVERVRELERAAADLDDLEQHILEHLPSYAADAETDSERCSAWETIEHAADDLRTASVELARALSEAARREEEAGELRAAARAVCEAFSTMNTVELDALRAALTPATPEPRAKVARDHVCPDGSRWCGECGELADAEPKCVAGKCAIPLADAEKERGT